MGFVHIPVTVVSPGRVAENKYESLFLVDTGAIDSMAPSSEMRRIGIEPVGRKKYELADGSHREYDFGIAQFEFMGEIPAGESSSVPKTSNLFWV